MRKRVTRGQRDGTFLQGVAYAASEMARAFDQPGYSWELLRNAGLTTARALKAAGIDEYDAKVCRAVLRSEHRPA